MDTKEKQYTLDELKKQLTDKQKIFCHSYICKWNGTQSYKDAYGVEEDNTAGAAGNRLLRNVKIIQYIDFIKTNYEKEAGISKLSQLNTIIKIIDDEKSTSKDILAAIAESNKMMGYHEPDKLDIRTPGKEIKLNFDE